MWFSCSLKRCGLCYHWTGMLKWQWRDRNQPSRQGQGEGCSAWLSLLLNGKPQPEGLPVVLKITGFLHATQDGRKYYASMAEYQVFYWKNCMCCFFSLRKMDGVLNRNFNSMLHTFISPSEVQPDYSGWCFVNCWSQKPPLYRLWMQL